MELGKSVWVGRRVAMEREQQEHFEDVRSMG